MIPLVFDGVMARLHPAEPAKASGLGVVIVPPHGLEALAAAKSLRLLAEALAARGHAALRFDLPGTGDSLGADTDPDRLDAWTDSIAGAARQLSAHAGVTGIVLVGLRLGALLAARAAPAVAELAGLVLLDPVMRGRGYGRELMITARAVAEGARLDPEATSTPAGLSIGGLLTSASTLDALKSLDLAKLPPPPAPVLVLHRKGVLDAAALGKAWTDKAVTAEEAAGFEAIGLSPTVAVTPLAAVERCCAWIDTLPRRDLTTAVAAAPARLQGPDFVEEAVTFGPQNRLFGVACRPASGDAGPMLLIVNAGRNPHIGWARGAVSLARRLSGEGVASFRMDVGGVGDGADRPGAADTLDQVLYHPDLVGDVSAALDWLEANGYPRIALMGACSGAHLALHSAAADARVQGLVLVNIQRFVWREGETVEQAIASSYAVASSYVSKLWDLKAWSKVLSGERSLVPLITEFARRLLARARSFVPSAETRAARALMARLDQRKVPVDLVYSDDDAGLEELARHFGARGRNLGRMRQVRFGTIPDTDHDLTPDAAREALFVRTLAAARTWREAAQNTGPKP